LYSIEKTHTEIETPKLNSQNFGVLFLLIGDFALSFPKMSSISKLDGTSPRRKILSPINPNPEISAVKIAQALSVNLSMIERDIRNGD